jgi:hypothetical protein
MQSLRLNQSKTRMSATATQRIDASDRAAERARPMLPISGVKAVLNFTESEILTRLDLGSGPRWVFDIALDPKVCRRRELRFLPDAIADFAQGRESALDWDGVINALIPHENSLVSSPELEHCLNSSNHHLARLAERGSLKVARPGRRGPKGATIFFRNSFEDFLRKRLVS